VRSAFLMYRDVLSPRSRLADEWFSEDDSNADQD